MAERFPGVIWYCDNCHDCLSNQIGFDDHKRIWKCTECGWKNSISKDNIKKNDSFGDKLFSLFGMLLADIEEVFFIGIIGLVLSNVFSYLIYNTFAFSLVPSIEIKDLYDLSFAFMNWSIYGYLLSSIISVILQKLFGLYGDENYRKNIFVLILLNIYYDFSFLISLFTYPISTVKKGFKVFPIIRKILVFIIVWLIPVLLIAYGLVYEYTSIHLPMINLPF